MMRPVAIACVLSILAGWVGAASAEEVAIQVSPSTINLSYQGSVVTVHAEIPYYGVVTASLELNGVEVWWTKADSRGELVAKFDVDRVKDIVAPPSAELTLIGSVRTSDGGEVPFFGVDTVRVVNNTGKR